MPYNPDGSFTPDAAAGGGWFNSLKEFAGGDGGKVLGALVGGLGGLTGGSTANQPTGYQGGIPDYRATRDVVPNVNPEGRRPGSSGQRYFTDVQYEIDPENPYVGYTAEEWAARNAAAIPTEEDSLLRDWLSQYNPTVSSSAGASIGPAYNPALPPESTQPAGTPAPPAVYAGTGEPVRPVYSTPTELFASKPQSGQRVYNLPPANGDYLQNSGALPAEGDYSAAEATYVTDMIRSGEMTPAAASFIYGVPISYVEDNMQYFAEGGMYLDGATDGMADLIPANIGEDQEARLSDGEFVVAADVVSHLGNGNSTAGADVLEEMMGSVRKARTGTEDQGKQINPNQYIPR